eukprot:5961273-Amphidinium_carterae.2
MPFSDRCLVHIEDLGPKILKLGELFFAPWLCRVLHGILEDVIHRRYIGGHLNGTSRKGMLYSTIEALIYAIPATCAEATANLADCIRRLSRTGLPSSASIFQVCLEI